MDQRPNIVMIMADQLAANAIGAMGHPVVKTPNIDRLIGQGVAFTNSYCNSPLCAPSRASFMSGRLVRHIGTFDNGAEFPAGVPTFVHLLRNNGYETVLSGKMHFVGPDQLHGFEERLTSDIYPAAFNWTPDWSKGAYPNLGTSVKRLKSSGECNWNKQLAYDEEVLFRTLERIRKYGEHKSDRPFFLCSSFTHPHCPFKITPEYWDMYKIAEVPLPKAPAVPLELMHPYNQWIQIHHEIDQCVLTEQELIDARRSYYGMVTYFDQLVGQITGELERQQLMDNTVILVLSDHGEMLGEHGMWFKRTFYDPSAKVPLIISYPGRLKQGLLLEQIVSLVDVAPTILDLAGINEGRDLLCSDGESLLGLMEGSRTAWRNRAVCEYFGEGPIHSMVSIREGRYKFVYVHEEAPLLFDLANDPEERIDLSSSEEHQAILDDFRNGLMQEIDMEALENHVLRSQRERILIAGALKTGKKMSWDYEPTFPYSK